MTTDTDALPLHQLDRSRVFSSFFCSSTLSRLFVLARWCTIILSFSHLCLFLYGYMRVNEQISLSASAYSSVFLSFLLTDSFSASNRIRNSSAIRISRPKTSKMSTGHRSIKCLQNSFRLKENSLLTRSFSSMTDRERVSVRRQNLVSKCFIFQKTVWLSLRRRHGYSSTGISTFKVSNILERVILWFCYWIWNSENRHDSQLHGDQLATHYASDSTSLLDFLLTPLRERLSEARHVDHFVHYIEGEMHRIHANSAKSNSRHRRSRYVGS